MLTDSIKQHITSLSLSELMSLCEEHVAEHGEHSEKEFVTYLYHNKKITLAEFKNIQATEKVNVGAAPVTYIGNVAKKRVAPSSKPGKLPPIKTKNNNLPGFPNIREEFSILESIDEGAMGEILTARDNKLNRIVAYKKIHPHVAEIPSYLGRFFMEAQITAQLQHPNIVPVYSLMLDNKSIAYTMKLIDGVTLKGHVRETQEQYVKYGAPDEHHTLHARLEHFLKVCDAMHYAHRKGVIHRDLKPLNIMIGPYNEVYVMDWGIAKMVDVDRDTFSDKTVPVGSKKVDDRDKTKQGQVMGTPAYMSPEQAEGEHDILDHRSDLYSLGLILFELVTFHRAINGKNTDEVMLKARRGYIDPPPSYGKQADIQEQLLAIVKKATQYLPEDRYPTVAAFADDIRRFIHGDAIKARPESRKQKVMRWVSQHRKAAVNIMLGSILFSFLSVVVVLITQLQSLRQTQSEDFLVNNFVSKASERSQLINSKFLEYQGILSSLTASATSLLNQGSINKKSRYYTNKTIANSKKGPADYKFSEVYSFPISVDYHVYKLAPGLSERKLKPMLQQLTPLQNSFESLLLQSYDGDTPLTSEEAEREAIMNEGLPLVWAHIGLEEGFVVNYPGRAEFPESYDPRRRPWYRGSINNTEIAWLKPYIDVGGQGALLPLTSPLFNKDKKFIGVASVALTLDYVRRQLIPLYGIKGLENIYLVNKNFEIIVSLSDKTRTYGVNTLVNSTAKLDLFPHDYVIKKMKAGESGHSVYFDKDREKIVAYYKIKANNWYYIAVTDKQELTGKMEDHLLEK